MSEEDKKCFCGDHSEHNFRLKSMEDSMKTIKRMFWSIILGILLILVKPDIKSFFQANNTQADIISVEPFDYIEDTYP